MELKFAYEPAGFNKCLSDIRKSFPSIEERVKVIDKCMLASFIERLGAIGEDDAGSFGAALKGRELELIPYTLREHLEADMARILESILRQRFRKKLFKLCWSMFQEDYKNPGLVFAMKIVLECMKVGFPEEYQDSFSSRLDGVENLTPETVKTLLVEEGADIKVFCRKYSLNENSAFAMKLREVFFLDCGEEGFISNKDSLLKHINVDDSGSAALVFSRYLEMLKPRTYFDLVNNLALQKWGFIDDGGEFWDKVSNAGLEGFASWQKLKRIERHFGKSSKGFKLWKEHFDKMLDIRIDIGPGILVMFFERFTVLDSCAEEGFSFLYTNGYFKDELAFYEEMKEAGEDVPKWRVIPEHVGEFRDLVIEGLKSDVYRINYEKVQILYIKDILENELARAGYF